MNIFYLDPHPGICAMYHNNMHVIKMVLESCQLLSTAHRVNDGVPYEDRTQNNRRIIRYRHPNAELDQALYKATHINHPCAVWCRTSPQNYRWLWALTQALAKEYSYRYGKTHKCERDGLISMLWIPPAYFPSQGWSDPAQAMPDHCKHHNPVEAYRTYYRREKQHLAKWTKRNIPEWYHQLVEI
jgi:hypothetical protein